MDPACAGMTKRAHPVLVDGGTEWPSITVPAPKL
jgi:hypothetical protein